MAQTRYASKGIVNGPDIQTKFETNAPSFAANRRECRPLPHLHLRPKRSIFLRPPLTHRPDATILKQTFDY